MNIHAIWEATEEWHQRFLENRNLRVSNPRVKVDTVTSLGVGTETVDLIPELEPGPLDLVRHYTVGRDVQRVWVIREQGTSGATVVPEGQEKPLLEQGLSGEMVTLQPFAALVKASRGLLDDRGWLEATLRRLFGDSIEDALWAALLQAIADDPAIPDALDWRTGQTTVELAGHPPNAAIMNPTDWQTVESALPDGMAEASEVIRGLLVPMLGRMGVISTPEQPEGTAVLGDLRGLAMILQPGVDFSYTDSDGDDFVENRVTLRAEIMGAAVVAAPDRLCKVEMGPHLQPWPPIHVD